MSRLIRCECGFIARGDSDDDVVAAIESPMSSDHPEVLARLDRSEIYHWIEQTLKEPVVTTKAFDAAKYKTTTRAQWQAAAEAWDRWEPTIEDWLGAATETMLDCARIGTGSRVLDVAAGAGGQTLAAARRVGPTGRVLATDIAPRSWSTPTPGPRPPATPTSRPSRWTASTSTYRPGSFDAVISRVGLIYFPDRQARSPSMLRASRPAAGSRRSATPRPSATASSRCRSR